MANGIQISKMMPSEKNNLIKDHQYSDSDASTQFINNAIYVEGVTLVLPSRLFMLDKY